MKRLKKTVFYFLVGFVLAILWGIKSFTILFAIPILMLIFKDKRRLKIISFFVIGFLIFFIPAVAYNHYTSTEKISWNIKIRNHLQSIYDTFLSNAATLGEKEVKTVEEGFKFKDTKTIDDFENEEIGYIIKSGENCESSLSDKSKEGKQSLMVSCPLPLKEDLTFDKEINMEDWSRYNYIHLWISNNGDMESFEIIIEENDGDWWHYFDEKILQNDGWQSISVPLNRFKNPEWTRHGNRRRSFDKIRSLKFNFNPYEENGEGIYTVYIDKVYLVV
ncbi:hypothetical protein CL621_01590 [archaeon]|nr:hypothetical protein [archaeon]|tara:strand:+ start:1774 stop:2601 length:828 start_codon:yes stop_codon:yes gene_type:complete